MSVYTTTSFRTTMGPPLRQIHPATTTTTHTMSQYTSSSSFSTDPLPGPSIQSCSSPQPTLGMTPASRYDHNLRVMRRRDPSISSIMDQFSHVCLYNYNGQWDKHGFEGSMFLFERGSYPPYGLYIMNRHGRDDYVKVLYPEDEVVPSEKFLIIRSYPNFTEPRLKNLRHLHAGKDLDKFSGVYAIPNLDEIDPKSKGQPTIIGLWTLKDNSRESLTEVMQRLHSYIRTNEPYPEEFRYGPGRPPPPNRLRAIPKNTAGSTSDSQAAGLQSDSENERSYHSDAPHLANRGLSEIDRLFLKLGSQPTPPSQGGCSITKPDAPRPVPFLLQSIFASASSPAIPTPSSNATTGTGHIIPQTTTVHSPKPSSGTSGPQILNSQVLTSMLTGSAPSRASSVVSHPSSREGDNEGSGSDSPSTVLDEDSDYQKLRSIRRRTSRINSDLRNGNTSRLGQRVNGDVTPRLPLNGLQRTSSVAEVPSTSAARPSTHANPPAPFSVRDASSKHFTPFEADSDLWPAGQHCTTTDEDDDEDGSDIVEIDFAETSLLSDPDFTKVVKRRKSAVMLRQTDAVNAPMRAFNGNGKPSVSSERGKGKNRRKVKKEKEESERYRDLPTISAGGIRGRGTEKVLENGHPSVSRSLSSIPIDQKSVPAVGSEKTTALSGTRIVTSPSAKSKGRVINGHGSESLNGNGVANPVDPESVRLSVGQVLHGQHQPMSSTSKNEFVQQVLRLLQTDESFSEKLYADYLGRT